MADLTRETDRALAEARRVRDDNRAGGRHRRAAQASIGREAGRLKSRHLGKKIRNIVIALFALWVASGVIGTILGGIGFMGVMALIVASVVAMVVLGKFPRMKVPQRADLTRTTDA